MIPVQQAQPAPAAVTQTVKHAKLRTTLSPPQLLPQPLPPQGEEDQHQALSVTQDMVHAAVAVDVKMGQTLTIPVAIGLALAITLAAQ